MGAPASGRASLGAGPPAAAALGAACGRTARGHRAAEAVGARPGGPPTAAALAGRRERAETVGRRTTACAAAASAAEDGLQPARPARGPAALADDHRLDRD